MIHTTNKTIGEMVSDDFRTAAVFQSFGIDFCCRGNRTLKEACESKKIDLNVIESKLREVTLTDSDTEINFNAWPLDILAEYIENKHHSYVENSIPVLTQFLNKLCTVHGPRHEELYEINKLFTEGAGELTMHMKKEELVLFPFIKKLEKAKLMGDDFTPPHFGTVKNPVEMMKQEHETEGQRFEKIAELTNNYTPPADACNTYKVTFQMLKEFENDLHTHIHLENNILFPKAILLEKELSKQLQKAV